ncbi:cell envelope-related function transcriptional attenuator common domain-containing protein [Nocardioides exalbidus]|uniref:Cell envelope-related function transcriptional attenuator common domain-containing protein n=1 Tax=Nocardioides exalbidus TaxID=402596 RepID=A0A1H4VVR2_9ACTN|nr:LCP family protein [Nocardioides exalbidus]SEC84970.1 cell envelope-related function transcriptional attenuator common domain-containing protein [Nocardioides exalbidus]
MTDETTPTPASPTRRSRRRTVLKVVLVSALVLALVTGVGTWLFVRHLDGNIETGSLDELGPGRPERQYTGNGKPLNILVMGDDSRAGPGNRIDDEAGAGGSDTTILVHLSADRSRAYAVSIPRDSIVDRPACNGGESPAATDVMWNAAFTVGQEFCTADQFEQMTDVLLDHYVVVDFNGFGQMVDAVDGVPVCVPYDIVDRANGIFVPAGDPSVLRGDQALDYFRARYVGDQLEQNDISRIRRQQEFIGALVRTVQSAGTLARPDRVVRFLNAATKSLRTDEELGSVTQIARIALQLQDIGLDKVQFVTLPTEYYDVDSDLSGKVYWTPDAFRIWDLLNRDEVLPASLIGDTSVDAEGPRGGKGSGGAGSGGSSGGSSGGGSADEPVYGICG